MLAEIWFLGNGIENVVGHILWVGCGETHTHIWYTLCHLAQQFGKRASTFNALSCRSESITVYILTKKRYLLESTVVQVLNLTQYAIYVARTFTTTCVRHDAVVAEVVATTHNANKTTYTIGTNALWYNVAIGLGSRQLYVASVSSILALCNHIWQIKIRVGTAHQIGMMIID